MRSEALRAELAMLDLEDRFVAAKQAGEATPELRAELREARRAYRQLREAGDADPGVALAQPVTARSGVAGGEN